ARDVLDAAIAPLARNGPDMARPGEAEEPPAEARPVASAPEEPRSVAAAVPRTAPERPVPAVRPASEKRPRPAPGAARFYLATTVRGVGSPAANSALMRSLDRELRRLPRVTTTLEGPATDARLAELGLLGFTVEVNVSRLAAASGQLDCDVRVVFVTLPGSSI